MLTDVFCNFRPSLALTFIYILKISQRCHLLRNRPQCEYDVVHYKAVMCETQIVPMTNLCLLYMETQKHSLTFYLNNTLFKHKLWPAGVACPFWWHYLIQAPQCWISVIFFITAPVLETLCHLASKTLYGNPNPWNLLGAVNVQVMVSNPAIYWSAREC